MIERAIAGVVAVVGCVAGIAAVALLVTLLIRCFRKNRTQHA